MNETLYRALTRAALSEIDVAARLEVDPKTVRRWMDGRVPYLRHRLALCALLGVSQADLWPQLRRDGSWPDEVSAVYPHLDAVPHEVWLHMFGSARHEVDVLARVELLTADGLVMNALLASPIRPRVRVRICIGQHDAPSRPEARPVDAHRDAGNAAQAALALVVQLRSLSSAAARLHKGVLYSTICRADDELLVVQYAYGIDPRQGSAILLSNVGTAQMFGGYAGSFERVWKAASPVGGERPEICR